MGLNSHSMAIDKNHNLWSCGRNDAGQLGDGTTEDRYSPIKIDIENPILLINSLESASIDITRYLINDSNQYKTYNPDSGWEVIHVSSPTRETFEVYGIEDLSVLTGEAISQLESDTPELLCYTSEDVEEKTVKGTVKAPRWVTVSNSPVTEETLIQEGMDTLDDLNNTRIDQISAPLEKERDLKEGKVYKATFKLNGINVDSEAEVN